jgi:hypothetical protein
MTRFETTVRLSALWLPLWLPLWVACTTDGTALTDDGEAVAVRFAVAAVGSDTGAGSGSESAAGTAAASVKQARMFFTFWASENVDADAAGSLFTHYFDYELSEAQDAAAGQALNTAYYYPLNNAPLFGSGYAVTTDSLADEVTVVKSSVARTETGGLSVAITQPDKSSALVDNSLWQSVYVSRSAAGAGYVAASRLNPYAAATAGDFSFTHCVTRLDLRMCRSSNMSGDDEQYNVHNIKVYAQERCVPTALKWSPQGGFQATSGSASTEWVPLLEYNTTMLPSKDLQSVGSLCLCLDDFAPTKTTGYELLALQIKADYGSDTKTFTTTDITMTPSSSKTAVNYQPGEVYTLSFEFDIDAITCKAELKDWETGASTIITIKRPSGTD